MASSGPLDALPVSTSDQGWLAGLSDIERTLYWVETPQEVTHPPAAPAEDLYVNCIEADLVLE